MDTINNILSKIYNFFFAFENRESFNPSQDFKVLLVGFVLVLCALLLLALFVSLLPKIVNAGSKGAEKRSAKKATKEAKKTDDAASEGEVAVEAEVATAKEAEEDEEELIAVLTAAIMSYYGNETKCNLKVTSFKRIDNNSNAWSNAGRRDSLDASL